MLVFRPLIVGLDKLSQVFDGPTQNRGAIPSGVFVLPGGHDALDVVQMLIGEVHGACRVTRASSPRSHR
jgi:hypothetical protein